MARARIRRCAGLMLIGVSLAAAPAARAQDAPTMLDPATPAAGAVAGQDDSDVYVVDADAPAWQRALDAAQSRSVAVSARRSDAGCAEDALRVTLHAAGQAPRTATVYPGSAAATVASFTVASGARYELKVDTGGDPDCAHALAYTLTAVAYTPVSVGAHGSYDPSPIDCQVYTRDVIQLKRQIRRTKSSRHRQLAKLSQNLKLKTTKRNVACRGLQ